MFEKEAEKWTIDYVCKDCSKYKECKSKEHCTCKECSKEKWQNGAEYGYNKCKEELNHKGLALQSDMDKTIEQNIALKKELNKANEWHYAKDEIPSEDAPLLCVRGGRVYITWYYNGVYHDSRCCQVKKPYAWKEIILPGQEG